MPAERSSVARPLSPQDAGGCRAIPRPGGPPRTSLPPSGSPERQPARGGRRIGVSGFIERAAGRGVDAQTVARTAANPREGAITLGLKGAGQGCPAPSGTSRAAGRAADEFAAGYQSECEPRSPEGCQKRAAWTPRGLYGAINRGPARGPSSRKKLRKSNTMWRGNVSPRV